MENFGFYIFQSKCAMRMFMQTYQFEILVSIRTKSTRRITDVAFM